MPGLREFDWQISYGPNDDRLANFYLPALSRCIRFDRATGFFSSAALAVAAAGIARLIRNGGRMRLLCGAQLSPDDVEAIKRGADLGTTVGARMVGCLADPTDQSLRARLEALAWMVAGGTLEIRVVLPRGPDGHPLPAEQAREYYHPKEGVFEDAGGDRLAFSGSSNESETSWQWNYEVFCVYRSWDASNPYLLGVALRFEALWQGKEKGWIALPIPEAARARLLRYTPAHAPTADPLEQLDTQKSPAAPGPATIDQGERILFQFVRDAPFLANAGRLGQSTSAVRPWPHQQRAADRIVREYPQGCLLCDEVGLGKTVEAGLALRQLLLSGQARRVLILTPKSVARQWQEELYEKFVLNIPRYDGAAFTDVFDRDVPAEGGNPWNRHPVLVASSQLAKRKDRQPELLVAEPWDMVLVDEAHHARRKDFLQLERDRPNRLLELLRQLRGRTKALLLLTATPMQIHPVEVWDLLALLGLSGAWGAGEENFLRFFAEVRKPTFGDVDWAFVLRMVRAELGLAGGMDAGFAEEVERRLGPVEWRQLQTAISATDPAAAIRPLSEQGRAALVELARRHTPLRRLAQRNTRALLRSYQQRGILKERVPTRDPRPVWVPFTAEERRLYERIEEYISDFYRKYESERKGLGFIMTVYRRRLTSSFYAIQQSLTRRLEFLEGRAMAAGLVDDDDVEQDELDLDVGEESEGIDPTLFAEEIEYVKDFLRDLGSITGESKVARLLADLHAVLSARETVLIFTQYTDTMDFLREQLRPVYGSQVACYSGRGGEQWDGTRWAQTSKEHIKQLFREGKEIKILLGTEAASEGLNLQTCGVLLNFDVPWNPMRVEQRIGRIDRIGQVHDVVWIRNYFYEESVEAAIYRRLEDRIAWFETVVGELQPILAKVAATIRDLAMTRGAERTRRLDEATRTLREQLDSREMAALDLDRYVEGVIAPPEAEAPSVSLPELEGLLLKSRALGDRFSPHPSIVGAYLLRRQGSEIGVTFDPAIFDQHPSSLRLFSFGEALLDELLGDVPAPEAATDHGRIIRCAGGPHDRCRGVFAEADGRLEEITSLARLRERFAIARPHPLPDGAREDAAAVMRKRAAQTDRILLAAEAERRKAEAATLVEEGRQLLVKATAIELAMARHRELWDEPSVLEFSADAVGRLRQKGYPYAPLLRQVGAEGLRLSPADAYFLRIQEDSREALLRRRASIENRMKEVVAELERRRQSPPMQPEGAPLDIQVSVAVYA